MSESPRDYARRLRSSEMVRDRVCEKCGVSVSPSLRICTKCSEPPCERCDVFLRRIEKLEAELRKLREENARLDGGFDRRCADFLADEVAVLIKKRVIDERSPAADALLDYRNPPRTERSDRLDALAKRVEELETMLAEWGKVENGLAAIDLLPEVIEYLEHGGIVPPGMVKRGEAFVKRSSALRAVRSVAIEIATRRAGRAS